MDLELFEVGIPCGVVPFKECHVDVDGLYALKGSQQEADHFGAPFPHSETHCWFKVASEKGTCCKTTSRIVFTADPCECLCSWQEMRSQE